MAYGAKVGSNHTGRAADQEAVLGEGVFFGLGVRGTVDWVFGVGLDGLPSYHSPIDALHDDIVRTYRIDRC